MFFIHAWTIYWTGRGYHLPLQMYTYSVPDSPDCHEHISGFVSSGYTLVPRQAVPKESAGAVPDAQVSLVFVISDSRVTELQL